MDIRAIVVESMERLSLQAMDTGEQVRWESDKIYDLSGERRYGRRRYPRAYGKAMTAGKLAKAAGLHRQTVYGFLAGSPINSDALGAMLDVLRLKIVPDDTLTEATDQ